MAEPSRTSRPGAKDMGHSLKEQFSENGEHHFLITKS